VRRPASSRVSNALPNAFGPSLLVRRYMRLSFSDLRPEFTRQGGAAEANAARRTRLGDPDQRATRNIPRRSDFTRVERKWVRARFRI